MRLDETEPQSSPILLGLGVNLTPQFGHTLFLDKVFFLLIGSKLSKFADCHHNHKISSSTEYSEPLSYLLQQYYFYGLINLAGMGYDFLSPLGK